MKHEKHSNTWSGIGRHNDVQPPVFELTDPAAHYSEMTNRKDYGRTDRGEEGIQDFLKTHKCSNLCHMLLHRWIAKPLDNDIIQYHDALDNKERSLQVETGVPTLLKLDNDKEEPEEVKQKVLKHAKTFQKTSGINSVPWARWPTRIYFST